MKPTTQFNQHQADNTIKRPSKLRTLIMQAWTQGTDVTKGFNEGHWALELKINDNNCQSIITATPLNKPYGIAQDTETF